jgi:NADH-quinone oxidoreductase subunit C
MEKLNNQDFLAAIQAEFGTAVLAHEEAYGMLNIEAVPSSIHQMIAWLQQHPSLSVNYLTNIAGIHYPENANREFAVVYQLHSWKNNLRLRIKGYLAKDALQIATITDLFAGANWMERETYDFYGIEFTGHPDLRRILNMDDMDYFPMRKEYVLEDGTREDKDDRFFGRNTNEI